MRVENLAVQLQRAPPAQFWLVITLGCAVVALWFWRAYIHLQRRRLIADTPTAMIRSAAQGYVELQGRTELIEGEPILAPLSNRPCTWYRYQVEQQEQTTVNGRKRTEWRTLEDGVSDNLFYLNDGTGRCAIDPDHAIVTPSQRQTWYGRTRIARRPEPSLGFLAGASGLLGLGGNYRYTEERIDIGADLHAMGQFYTAGGASTPFDREAEIGVLLRAWKSDKAALLASFDGNGDGQVDVREWHAVREAAAQEVHAARAPVTLGPAVDVLAATGDRQRPFILSATTEDRLLRRYGRLSLGYFLIATGGAWALCWAISQRA